MSGVAYLFGKGFIDGLKPIRSWLIRGGQGGLIDREVDSAHREIKPWSEVWPS